MSLKNRSRNKDSDPSFNLDNYLEEKSSEFDQNREFEEEIEKVDRRYTNVLIVAVAITGMLWYMDWTPKALYQSLFGGSNVEVITGTPVVVEIPDINVDIPEINIPEINIPDIDIDIDPDFPGEAAAPTNVIEYLQELQNLGLLDDKISAFSAREVYNAGVPVSYLVELDQRGLLEDLSFVAIDAFYNNQIPFEYLQEVEDNGFADKLSFIDIAEFYKTGVTFEYLTIMDETGYLDELSFVQISEYYKNNIPPEFLDELKQSGIYESLSFIDVVEIYKSQN